MPFARSARTRLSAPIHVWSDDDTDSVVSSVVSTTATDALPPLTRGNSIVSMAGSAKTDKANSVLGQGCAIPLEDGVPTLLERDLPNAQLLCPFQILDCDEVFADVRGFKEHVFSHFRGFSLPSEASCFLCDAQWKPDAGGSSVDRWNSMLSHMVHEHYRQGQRLATVRTDFKLMRWMWHRRLISNHHFRRTQLMPIPIEWPGQLGHPSEIINLPSAPAPPPPSTVRAMMEVIEAERDRLREYNRVRQDHAQAFTINAGFRAERRRRDATRLSLRPQN